MAAEKEIQNAILRRNHYTIYIVYFEKQRQICGLNDVITGFTAHLLVRI